MGRVTFKCWICCALYLRFDGAWWVHCNVWWAIIPTKHILNKCAHGLGIHGRIYQRNAFYIVTLSLRYTFSGYEDSDREISTAYILGTNLLTSRTGVQYDELQSYDGINKSSCLRACGVYLVLWLLFSVYFIKRYSKTRRVWDHLYYELPFILMLLNVGGWIYCQFLCKHMACIQQVSNKCNSPWCNVMVFQSNGLSDTISKQISSIFTNLITGNMNLTSIFKSYRGFQYTVLFFSIFSWCSHYWYMSNDKRGYIQWRLDGRDGASNHQPHDCLLNR